MLSLVGIYSLFDVLSGISLHELLEKSGIQTVIHYPVPPHLQSAFSSWNHLNLPVTEKIHQGDY